MTPEIAWGLGAAGIVFLALIRRNVRRAWLNGWRCLARHGELWRIPAAFALIYVLFEGACSLLLTWRLDALELPAWRVPPFAAPEITPLLDATLLPGAESLAAALNCLVATFPISAAFGLLFFVNWRGLTGELAKALARRFGAAGWLLFAILVLCAVCAVVKPVLFLALPELAGWVNRPYFLPACVAVNALSFVFEYLLGTCVQIRLLLAAYAWVRGLHFPPGRLMRFAVRRLGFVLKWALVIVGATLLLIHVPLLAGAIISGDPAVEGFEEWTRPILAAAMLILAPVQIRLALHNDSSLRAALRAQFIFVRRHGADCLVFLLSALLVTWFFATAQSVAGAWTEDTLWPAAAGLQVAGAAAGGWILAAWVCLYKSLESRPGAAAY